MNHQQAMKSICNDSPPRKSQPFCILLLNFSYLRLLLRTFESPNPIQPHHRGRVHCEVSEPKVQSSLLLNTRSLELAIRPIDVEVPAESETANAGH